MKTVDYELPSHWVCPLEYGSDSYGEMSDSEIAEFERFCSDVEKELGICNPLSYGDEESDFRRYHDATAYGVLACNVVTVTFEDSRHAA